MLYFIIYILCLDDLHFIYVDVVVKLKFVMFIKICLFSFEYWEKVIIFFRLLN